MRIAILGGPGSGKGTQAKMLAERYRVPQISTGDLLREACKNDKKNGKQIKAKLDAGQLVEDEITQSTVATKFGPLPASGASHERRTTG